LCFPSKGEDAQLEIFCDVSFKMLAGSGFRAAVAGEGFFTVLFLGTPNS